MVRGRVLAAVFLSLLSIVLVASPAPAAEAAHGDEGVFAGSLDLAIWTLLVFLLLLLVLGKFAWRPMLDALRLREESIRTAIEEAKIARGETERMRDEFRAEMVKAQEQIPKLMDEARRDAERLREEMRAAATKTIQEDRERLRREIDMARDQALQEIWSQAAQLATLISAKALRRQVSSEDHHRLVDEALTELREASASRR